MITLTDSIRKNALGWSGKLGWTEGFTTILRHEACTVDLPGGPLDVRGDEYLTALLVGGRIRALQWCDYEGSIGQNLVRATSSNGTSAVSAFREAVSASVLGDTHRAVHFSEALTIIAAGSYTLSLEEIPPDAYVVDLVHQSGDDLEVAKFYPGFGALVATQPLNTLSASRVDELCDEIRNGARPIVITLSADGAWGEFIIDGHHKISAYRQANVPILRLNVVRLDSARISLEEVWDAVPDIEGLRENLMGNWPG